MDNAAAGGVLGLDIVDNVDNVAWVRGAGDDGGDASGGREAGGDDFGGHAAGAEGGAGGGDVCFERRYVFDDFDCLCIWVRPGVLVVQTVDVCHEEEVVCLQHGCGDGGKGVVVTKFVNLPDFLGAFSNVEFDAAFHLTNRDSQCIVLVYYRNYSHVEKLSECVLCIQILCTLLLC